MELVKIERFEVSKIILKIQKRFFETDLRSVAKVHSRKKKRLSIPLNIAKSFNN